jgi:hypothetical protein
VGLFKRLSSEEPEYGLNMAKKKKIKIIITKFQDTIKKCSYCEAPVSLHFPCFCDKHWLCIDQQIQINLRICGKKERIEKEIQDALNYIQNNKKLLNPQNEKLLYYAHPMGFYNSDKEQDHIKLIKKLFPEYKIINPSHFQNQGFLMRHFVEIVSHCDIVVAQPFDDGLWGAGVFKEICVAKSNNTQVKMIENNQIKDIPFINFHETLSKEETFARNNELQLISQNL